MIKYLTELEIRNILEATDKSYAVHCGLWVKDTEDGPEGFYSAHIALIDGSGEHLFLVPVTVRDSVFKKKYRTREYVVNAFDVGREFTVHFTVNDYDDFSPHKPYYEMTDTERKRYDSQIATGEN